jgi:hypothetical protein
VISLDTSTLRTIAVCQKTGFCFSHIECDFFSAERGNQDEIEENGIPLKNIIWMDQRLTRDARSNMG